jgi:hypothetical protein
MWTHLGWHRLVGALAAGLLLGVTLFCALSCLDAIGFTILPPWAREVDVRWVIPVVFMLCVIVGIMPRVAKRSFLTYLQRCDHLACTECGYNLRGLPEKHECPECGVRFDLTKVRQTWDSLFPPNP